MKKKQPIYWIDTNRKAHIVADYGELTEQQLAKTTMIVAANNVKSYGTGDKAYIIVTSSFNGMTEVSLINVDSIAELKMAMNDKYHYDIIMGMVTTLQVYELIQS